MKCQLKPFPICVPTIYLRASSLIDDSNTAVCTGLLCTTVRVGRPLADLHDPFLPVHTVSEHTKAPKNGNMLGAILSSRIPTTQLSAGLCGDITLCVGFTTTFYASNCFDNPAHGYVDPHIFQPEGGKSPWTMIMNDTWRSEDCLFAFFCGE